MRPRYFGSGFLILTALLLVWNLWAFVRNQTGPDFGADDKLAVRSRSIARAAKQNVMSVVNTTFFTYHSMRERIAGKHLLIPADLAAHQFALERVARVSTTVAKTRLELPRDIVQRIFDKETNQLWSFGSGTFTGAVLDPSTDRYVVVWRAGDNGVQVVIPEARYQRELAAIAPEHR